jgi:hypothetical protein
MLVVFLFFIDNISIQVLIFIFLHMYLAALSGAKKIRLINLQNRIGKMSTSASTDVNRK